MEGNHCLELGCGIGRVTKHVLCHYFERIDINDLLEEYTDQTRAAFEDEPEKIDRAFTCSIGQIQLDSFPKYDLIWAQCRFPLPSTRRSERDDLLVCSQGCWAISMRTI